MLKKLLQKLLVFIMVTAIACVFSTMMRYSFYSLSHFMVFKSFPIWSAWFNTVEMKGVLISSSLASLAVVALPPFDSKKGESDI